MANSLIANGYPKEGALMQAQALLIRHEQAHFQTDLGITSIELALGAPLYISARKNYRVREPWHKYEEGLANRLARKVMKGSIAEKKAFDQFLNSSPAGYRDWNSLPHEDPEMWRLIIQDLITHTIYSVHECDLAAEVSNKVAPKYFNEIPVYEHYDIPSGNPNDSYLMGPITEIIETEEFKKDLTKLAKGQPIFRKKWQGVKVKLAAGNVVGVHLEIVNKMKGIYSVRIDGEARAGIRRDFSLWEAVAAGHHDELYRRLGK